MTELFNNFHPDTMKYLIIPVLILLARVMDVSIGTIRIVFLARGEKILSPILGFFEVLIWVIAMGQVMQNLNSPVAYLAWASGFAIGNYVGLSIEQRLALGRVVIRVISTEPAYALMEKLDAMHHRSLIIDAESSEGKKNILFSIVKRKKVKDIIPLIHSEMPKAYFTIEGVQQVSDTLATEAKRSHVWFRRLYPTRKGK